MLSYNLFSKCEESEICGFCAAHLDNIANSNQLFETSVYSSNIFHFFFHLVSYYLFCTFEHFILKFRNAKCYRKIWKKWQTDQKKKRNEQLTFRKKNYHSIVRMLQNKQTKKTREKTCYFLFRYQNDITFYCCGTSTVSSLRMSIHQAHCYLVLVAFALDIFVCVCLFHSKVFRSFN